MWQQSQMVDAEVGSRQEGSASQNCEALAESTDIVWGRIPCGHPAVPIGAAIPIPEEAPIAQRRRDLSRQRREDRIHLRRRSGLVTEDLLGLMMQP